MRPSIGSSTDVNFGTFSVRRGREHKIVLVEQAGSEVRKRALRGYACSSLEDDKLIPFREHAAKK